MVQEIESLGGRAARFGAGIGAGVSEQLPKEAQRYVLNQGLENLQKRAPNLTPFQLTSALYTTPGITPDLANQLAPQLQSQIARQEFLQGKQPVSGQGQPGIVSGPSNQAQNAAPQQQNTQVSPEDRRAQPGYGVPSQEPQILDRARQLAGENPYLYPTRESAVLEAEREDAKRIAQDQAYENRRNLIQGEFDKSLQRQLHKEGLGTVQDVAGELQENFLRDAFENSTESPTKLGQDYASKALEFAKARNQVKELGTQNWKSWFTNNEKQTRKSLDQARKSYKDAGAQESMVKDLQTYHDLSNRRASFIAYPPQDSPQAKKIIDSAPNPLKPELLPNQKTPAGFTKKLKPIMTEKQLAADIGKVLKDDDSLQSLALYAESKGYDPEAFLDYFRNNDEVRISKRQGRELGEIQPFLPSMSDIFLFVKAGLDPVVE